MIDLIGRGLLETLLMVVGSTLAAYIIGIPLGLLLVVTDRDGIHPMLLVNRVVGVIVNIFRSIPFIILLVWVMPVTR